MFSTWVGVVLLFVVFGLFVWVVIGASPRGDTYEAKRAKAREEKLKTLREEANKALTTYGWVDKTKGVARVPIDRAMELTLADLATKKPAPANPIATPEPQASAAPAPNAAPPKAGAPSPSPQPAGSATPKPAGQPAGTSNPAAAPPGPSLVHPPRQPRRPARLPASAATRVPNARRVSSCKSAARARKNAMSIAEKTKQSLVGRDSVEPKHSLGFLARIKRYQKNAEIIFDAEEPIGIPTDLVMPRRRWFRRNKILPNDTTSYKPMIPPTYR